MLRFKARPRKDPSLQRELTASQRRMMRVLSDAMDRIRAQVVRDEGKILDALLHDPIEKVVNMVPADPWLKAQPVIQQELLGELLDAGTRTKLPSIQKAVLEYAFDRTRPGAATWAAKEAGGLIVEVMEEQRIVVRDYVSRAQMGEFAPRQVARGLRDTIGLTQRQAGWVENFRAREISRLIREQDLNPDAAFTRSEAATARYHARIHRYRTETIARTEILRAANEGRNEAWAQGIEEGFINPLWQKRWSAAPDDRTCEICGSYDGFIVGITEMFPDGDPPVHPDCRCLVEIVPEEIATPQFTQSDVAALGLIGAGLLAAGELAGFVVGDGGLVDGLD